MATDNKLIVDTGIVTPTVTIPVSITTPPLVNGLLYHDDTQQTYTTYHDGMKKQLSSTIFCQTSDQTIGNTTTETTLIGSGDGILTMEANSLRVGSQIRICLWGYISTDVATPSVTVRFSLGGTNLATGVISGMTNGLSNNQISIDALIPVRAIGVTGAVRCNGKMVTDTTSASTMVMSILTTTDVTIDTTVANAIDVTFQWGTANASNIVTSTACTVELLH